MAELELGFSISAHVSGEREAGGAAAAAGLGALHHVPVDGPLEARHRPPRQDRTRRAAGLEHAAIQEESQEGDQATEGLLDISRVSERPTSDIVSSPGSV